MKYTILFLLILNLCSCSVVNKVFNKSKSRTDSTGITLSVRDSSVQKDSTHLTKTVKEGEQEITFWFGDDPGIYAPFKDSSVSDRGIYVNPQDYFFEVVEGKVKTNMPIKKATVKGKYKEQVTDSSAKHSVSTKTDKSEQVVSVSKTEKEATKTVKKWRFNWWWLLLLIPFVIYRYRHQIKSFVIHKITGL